MNGLDFIAGSWFHYVTFPALGGGVRLMFCPETGLVDTGCVRRYPKISIIVPVPPDMESPHSLPPLARLNYPEHDYEVIVARGRHPSKQRNSAAEMAEGEILFFLDDDSIADEQLLLNNVAYYRDPNVACVGGPNIDSVDEGVVGKAASSVLASIFGDARGCKRFAQRGSARPVAEDGLILCNVSARKDLFTLVGGFPENLYPNEENAFLSRILRNPRHCKIMYAPAAFVRRPRPTTAGGFIGKMFGYGMGRLNQTFVAPSAICALRMIAGFFPLYWVVVPLLAPMLALWSAAVYCCCDGIMAAKILATTGSPSVAALSMLLFPCMHMFYGLGILWALLLKITGLQTTRGGSVEVRRIKAFCDAREKVLSPETKESRKHGPDSIPQTRVEPQTVPVATAVGS